MPDSSLLRLNVRRRDRDCDADAPAVESAVAWNPHQTALLICDVWDSHWCIGASRRVDELAPIIDRTAERLRALGGLVVHAPSDTLQQYRDAPQRRTAREAPAAEPPVPMGSWRRIDPAVEPLLPIDDSDAGCDDDPPCPTGSPWRRQHPAIFIAEEDAITDSGVEVYNLFTARGVRHVLMCGVHTNMCVLGRSFGIRGLVKAGYEVVLLRDLTDAMYNSRMPPFVDHFAGIELVVRHIETYWCGTTLSADITGGAPFRFAADTRPLSEA